MRVRSQLHLNLKRGIGTIGLWIALCPYVWGASLSGLVEQANDAYQQGDYPNAIEKYQQAIAQKPENDIINFDLGTAYYKNKDYIKSLKHLQKALLTEDAALQQKTHYNLGNAYYRHGITAEDQNIDTAISRLENALDHLKTAVQMDAQDADAKANKEFVEQELKRLREKKRQQQQQQKQKQKQDQRQQQDQQKQNDQDKQQDQGQQQPSKQESGRSRDSSRGSQGQPQAPRDQTADRASGKDQQDAKAKDQKDASQDQRQDRSSGGKDQSRQRQPQDGKTPADEPEAQDEEGQTTGSQATSQEAGIQPRPSTASSAVNQGQPMTRQEAEMLLQRYQQAEEPKGLLNFYEGKSQTTPVLKDW